MAINDNQNTRFIYIRSTKQKIPCTEQQFQDFYRMAGAVRKKEQYHHRCKCPKQFFWACDGDCENCEHHLGYGTLSLDAPNTDDDSTLLDTELTEPVSMEDVYADRALLERLFQRLQELDPDADRIIQLWKENDKISDRSIAEALGRKPRTFADQMKRIRTELRKVRGY
jgi:DNA-directed RNA polymerase specialized sigma24 family protein